MAEEGFTADPKYYLVRKPGTTRWLIMKWPGHGQSITIASVDDKGMGLCLVTELNNLLEAI